MSKTAKSSGAPRRIHNVVVGTAGHIDHGKTAVVQRLTGIDADRLPEEKERGMTIDLGFARYQLRDGRQVGLIDVPGHERFIKNMVAGATGIDAVLLVVAADDGVMPQTREHLEIMRLLGLEHGLVVVTKIDLVGDDLRELAIEDVKDAVQGTFLEGQPIVPASSITGEGFDELVEALHRCVDAVAPRSTDGLFRMPIQRIFSSKGFGTVLTGVPVSGQAKIGDTLEVLPIAKKGRVRGVQAYMGAADRAQAGQSSAVNLADIDYKEVLRGMVLATPGYYDSATMLEVRFHYLASHQRPFRHLTSVRFHCGTAEALGTAHLLDQKALEPGQSGLVQLRLDDPVVVAPGDRFVLRLHSPMLTIGGGEIIDLSRWRLKRGKGFVIDKLKHKEESLGSPRERLLGQIEDRGFDVLLEKDAARVSGLPPGETRELIDELLAEGQVFASSRPGYLLSRTRFEEAKGCAVEAAQAFFRRNARRLLMEKLALRQAVECHDVFFHDLLTALETDGAVVSVRGEHLQWSFHEPRLSEAESRFRDSLCEAMKSSPFTPPRLEEVAERDKFDVDLARSIAQLLQEEGELVELADDVLIHRDAMETARARLRAHLEKAGSMTASEAKNLLDSSRKYIIPLLEMFDREGLTVRRGDIRELRKH